MLLRVDGEMMDKFGKKETAIMKGVGVCLIYSLGLEKTKKESE